MAIFKAAYAKRIEFYVGMAALIAVLAVFGEMAKMGHMVAVEEVIAHVWGWVAHFVTDVTSAEVGAAIVFRVLGAAE